MQTSEENEALNQGNRQLGRYHLKRRIARGGMAEVYLGSTAGAHGFEKTVAIKRILPKFADQRQFINMMVDEAKIMVLLNHPNIAQVIEFGEHGRELFIVMEYVDGHALSTLQKVMRNRNQQCDPLETCFIVAQTLRGLHAAHTQKQIDGSPANIIHRDVSPQNILISYDGHIKLVDFGVAKATDRLEETKQGTIKGKLRYLAPEIIEPATYGDGEIDGRVDVFSAGVILYEMLAGTKLFKGNGAVEIYDAILKSEIPDLRARGVDEALWEIVARALERRAKYRYRTAEAFANALQTYIYRHDPGFQNSRIADLMKRYREHMLERRTELEAEVSERLKKVDLQRTMMWTGDDSTAVGSRSRFDRNSQAETLKVKPNATAHSVESQDLSWSMAPELETQIFDADIHTQTMMPSIDIADKKTEIHEVVNQKRRRTWLLLLLLLLFSMVAGATWVSNYLGQHHEAAQAIAVEITTDPPGAQLRLDNDDLPRMTPTSVFLPRETAHQLHIEKDGYEVIRHQYQPDQQKGQEQLHFALKAKPIVVRLTGLPAEARVMWNGQLMRDGRIEGRPGEAGILTITSPLTEKFEERKTFQQNMPRDYAPRLTAKPIVPPVTEPAAVDVAPKKAPEVKAVSGYGRLRLLSKPYLAEVWVDGHKKKESTPLTLKLKSGRHKVMLKVPSKQLKQKFTVTILKDKTVNKTIEFK